MRPLPVTGSKPLTIRLRTKKSSSASSPAPPSVNGDSSHSPIDRLDGGMASPPYSHSSPMPETPSPPPEEREPSPEPMSELDLLMEDYYIRSRRRSKREQSPFTLESLANWSWSRVKEPVWVVQSYPSQSSSRSRSSGMTVSAEREIPIDDEILIVEKVSV